MKEFLTIGELANIFNMDVQLLRHYDTKGLLVPQVRNSENNRRFYHFDQVYPLATIRYLRRLDYSLAQIKAFLHSNGLRDNLQMLSQQAQQLRRDARALRGQHVREHDGRDVARRIEHRDFIFPFHFSGLHGGHSVKWTWLLM